MEAVTVNPTAPALSWAATASGVEGTAIALGSLGETVTGQAGDNNSANALTISGALAGAVLSDGHGKRYTFTGVSDAHDITGWNLSSLTVTPANDANFTLTATA